MANNSININGFDKFDLSAEIHRCVCYVTENRSVGGSIPPLGTKQSQNA